MEFGDSGRSTYAEARKKAESQVKHAKDIGRLPYPPALDDILRDEGALSEERVGIMEIPLDRIIGTKTAGRQEAFSYDFLPLLDAFSEFGAKWINLYNAQLDEGFRDPVKLYEYMGSFFVQEGNKRVSVAKYLNMAVIAADVIRVLPRRTEDPVIRQYYEFREFFRCFPNYDIEMSEPGGYEKLAEAYGQELNGLLWDEDLRRSVSSSFYAFKKKFDEKEKNYSHISVKSGDAYMLYIGLYGTEESAALVPDSLLDERVTKLWREYEFYAGSGKHKLLYESDETDNFSIRTVGLFRTPKYSEKHPLKAAFFYRGTTSDLKWTRDHEMGRQKLNEHYGDLIETYPYSGLQDRDSLRAAIDDAYGLGCELFFTTFPGMMPEARRSSIHYEKTSHFLNCSIGETSNAVRTYYGKMYEAKFILGALAASLCDNHEIGYIASVPTYGVISDINAFAIGAALLDPKAKIRLLWGMQKGARLEKGLEGVDILSGVLNMNPSEPTREYGLYRRNPGGKMDNLAMPVWDWGEYYIRIIRSVLAGSYEREKVDGVAVRYYYGLSSNVIDVVLSDKLDYNSHKLLNGLKKAIATGQINPFGGEIHTQDGVLQTEGRLSEDEQIAMDWLAENVEGTIPPVSEFDLDAAFLAGLEKTEFAGS
ncbi:MAG: BMP family ABC transporter substrate-binding protein [Lachnospiraceae bacterium]|nr:BMP family ABC transporter substrate-binding protein [Lachnospiraceae bacterium]